MSKATPDLQISTEEVQKLEVLSLFVPALCFIFPLEHSRAYAYNCSSISSLINELQPLHRSGISEFSIQSFSLKIENKMNNCSLLASHSTLHLKGLHKGMSMKHI